jgi:hypothetical protein
MVVLMSWWPRMSWAMWGGIPLRIASVPAKVVGAEPQRRPGGVGQAAGLK